MQKKSYSTALDWTEAVQKHTLDGCRLGCSRWTTNDDVVSLLNQSTDQELIALGVCSRDDDAVIWCVLWNDKTLDAIRPWLPLATILRIDVEIVQELFSRRWWQRRATCQIHCFE